MTTKVALPGAGGLDASPETPDEGSGLSAGLVLTARVFAWFAILPFGVLALLFLSGRPTWSGIAYMLGLAAVLGGTATLPRPRGTQTSGRRRGLTRAALLWLVIVAALRLALVGGHGPLRVAPSSAPDAGARLAARLVDEGDLAIPATRALVWGGILRDDAKLLPGAMTAAYAQMRAEHGSVATPVVPTYLGLQSAGSFDLVVVDPPRGSDAPPRGAIIFLHGFGGSFDLPCWQISKSVAPLGIVTACPSTRWTGDWGSSDGEATLRRTVAILRARGIQRFVLAGLSNGGFGASRLAPRMRGTFAGLVLISGALPSAAHPGVPTLVIHGRHDGMASFGDSRAYALRHGARLVALDAGHFAMIVRAAEHDRALSSFVSRVLPAPKR